MSGSVQNEAGDRRIPTAGNSLCGSMMRFSAVLSERALKLLDFRQIGGLVHPVALAAGRGPHFLDRLPEAKRAIGDCELGPDRKPASLQVEQQLLPGLCTLAHTVDQSDEFLLALGRGTDDHQQALRGVLEPGLHVDAVAASRRDAPDSTVPITRSRR